MESWHAQKISVRIAKKKSCNLSPSLRVVFDPLTDISSDCVYIEIQTMMARFVLFTDIISGSFYFLYMYHILRLHENNTEHVINSLLFGIVDHFFVTSFQCIAPRKSTTVRTITCDPSCSVLENRRAYFNQQFLRYVHYKWIEFWNK